MILHMCIAPRQGLTTPKGRNFYVNRNILSLWSFVASCKKSSLKSDFIKMFSRMNGKGFKVAGHLRHKGASPNSPAWNVCKHSKTLSNRMDVVPATCFWTQTHPIISVCPINRVFKNHDFIHAYSPGQGQTAPWGQSSDINSNVLSFHSFVASFKKMSLKSDFIHFFSRFNTCI